MKDAVIFHPARTTGESAGAAVGMEQNELAAEYIESAHPYCIQGSMIGRKEQNGPQGDGINHEVAFTLDTAKDVLHGLSFEDLCGKRRQRGAQVLRAEQPSGHRQPGGVRSGTAGAGMAQKPERQIQRKKLFCLACRLWRLRRVLRQ